MRDIYSEYQSAANAFDCEFKKAGARELTTFKGGGEAYVFYPESEECFIALYTLLSELFEKPFIIGGGSNTVIADGICKTPFISVKRLNRVVFEDGKVYAECGAYMSKVTECFRSHGLGGFEFLSGVPATVGGAVRMNASAFLHQTADNICKIRMLSGDFAKSGVKTVERDSIDFGYRTGARGVILGATFTADNIDAAKSLELCRNYTCARRAKQPCLPSCGSVFKNGDVPSGKLIELCGLKGTGIGGAQISDMHGNFIVNTGGATANDFMSLVRLAEERVYREFGIKLEREFVYAT